MNDVAGGSVAAAAVSVRRTTREVQFISRPGAGDIYAALTVPLDVDPAQLVLCCQPPFDEHSRAYPVMREFARRLLARGIGMLRFDYFGSGDSAGQSDEFSMHSAIADTSFLLSWLAARFPATRIVPMGVRLGGRFLLDALAAQSGAIAARVTKPILWDPVLDARDFIFTELRSTLGGSMMVYQAQVASREDIIRETLDHGFCERGGFKLNQIDGHAVSADLLRQAGFGAAGDNGGASDKGGASDNGATSDKGATSDRGGWSYREPVVALVTLRPGGNADRQRSKLAAALPNMEFDSVQDIPYWNQPPIYKQVREPLFALTEEILERCR